MAAISAAVLRLRRARATGWCCRRTATTRPGCSPRDELARFGVRVDYVATPEIEAVAAGGGLDGARLVLPGDAEQPAARRVRHRAPWRGRRTRPARSSRSTTRRRRRWASGRWSWAPTSRSAATPRRSPGTATCCWATSAPPTTSCTPASSAGATTPGTRPGPFEAWLGHRSMSTLDLRLARQAANAAAVAELLAGSPAVHRRPVAVAGRRPVVRARRPADAAAQRRGVRRAGRRGRRRPTLLARTRLWTAATSFGGVHSTIDRRAQWGGDAVAPGFVRLSCGIEDTADLVADLAGRARRAWRERQPARRP